jgi:serine/threonine protein kinase
MRAKVANEADTLAAIGGTEAQPATLLEAAGVSDPIELSSRSLWPVGTALASGRLSIVRRIGEGGMGVVYEAFDRERNARVALKTLNHLDAANVYGLKHEFRVLADVAHPNLVRLHELFREGDSWFFTMELVEGVHFDHWVRPQQKAPEDQAFKHSTLDEVRLRSALAQLVAAVAAIHAAGKLHRDLKPSNVLVTDAGRVVVLDFGLVAGTELGAMAHVATEGSVAGTPAYMAPEQGLSDAVTSASDYYAVGVMLFEALTGELPFKGRAGEMLAQKQLHSAPRAGDIATRREHAAAIEATPTISGARPVSQAAAPQAFETLRYTRAALPSDLEALCADLLAREPADRPDAATLHAKLGLDLRALERGKSARPSLAPEAAPELVGREAELLALREAYRASLAGTPTVLFVSGESGMGKSALVDAFLRELRAEGRALVLEGRCYERENVPYRGFDALVDELSRYLRKLPRDEALQLLPREVYALARLFPVLGRVPVVAEAPTTQIHDPQELQSRAFTALRELFWSLRERSPLVVHIDDLQWVDRDTTVLLGYLLGQRDTMPALAIGSHRVEGADHNALLQAIRLSVHDNRALQVRELRLGPLSNQAAHQLAGRFLGAHADAAALALNVSREAQGSPFFVGELARFAQRRGAAQLEQVSLDDALADHIAQLPDAARSLLELLALVGQPLASSLAVQAAGIDDGHGALDRLRAEQLVRGSVSADRVRRVECYHDRVREGVSAGLDSARRTALYAALASTLEQQNDADPELLATCYEGAGKPEQAARAAEQSGDRAVAALAFERAARLYQRALELGSFDRDAQRALNIKRAEALVGAGRGPDAARAYHDAAIGADAGVALELKREAAYQLMTTGHVDEGRGLLAEVLAAIGLRLPGSPRAALARAMLSRARLWLRGLAPHERGGSPLPIETARRLDALWTVVQGSSGHDPFVMVDMHARYLGLALDAGSVLHAARGLGYEAYLASFGGLRNAARASTLAGRALRLAESSGEPEVLGFALGIHACVAVNLGHFAEARKRLAQAAELYRTRCRGVAFELTCVEFYEQTAAYHLGLIRGLGVSASVLVEDALRRGDLWAATILGTSSAVPAWLALDDAGEVRARFDEARRRYRPQSSYQWPDAHLMLGEQRLLRYEGDAARAFQHACQQWPALASSQLLRVHHARAFFLHDRGACAVGALRQSGAHVGLARETAHADVRALRRTRTGYAPGWAALLEAALAYDARDHELAVQQLRSAIEILDANQIAMYAAASRRRLGQLLGGDEGKALLEQGDGAMHEQGVRNLEAMTEMLAPGCGVA